MPHYFRNMCKKMKHYNFVILNDFSNVITKSLNQLFFLLFFYHTEKRCWSLSGPCTIGQGVPVGKSFQNSLHMTARGVECKFYTFPIFYTFPTSLMTDD